MFDQALVKHVVTTLQESSFKPEVIVMDDQKTLNFFLGDLTLQFSKQASMKFEGLYFRTLDRNFFLNDRYELILTEESGSASVVTDEDLLKSLATYLRWRIAMVTSFGL